MTYIYLTIMLAFACCAVACTIAERKSRKWYQDRLLLRLSGFFSALAIMAFAFFVYEL